ncbi:MAG: DUF1800 domain-containing protein [Burkholderiales bacterium]|nr:DUF1800 domain-containing protein [Burkholderiales bacterium]
MRTFISFLFALTTLTVQAAGMGYDDARHLLARTGFAPTESEVQTYAKLSRAQAVDKLLSETRAEAQTLPPSWVSEPPTPLRAIKDLSEEERKQFQRQQMERGVALRSWWYQEMLVTPTPLTERMTLFWHNHFVSSQQKVKSAQLMYRQHVLLRSYALGNFGELLHAVSKDPAMILYLDNATNRRGQPNENFAREVMELFTLGVGQYTEQDIKEAARAFTGWSLDRANGEFHFYRLLHDGGTKTVLGRSGDFDGDAVLDILLAQPQTAEFISAKLWREFVSPDPDVKEVQRLARILREARYEIKPLLRALFSSEAFYVPANRARLIKSPVDLLVGTLRQFGIEGLDTRLLVFSGRQLNQDLFGPPNVKGWPGGDDWINSTTLLARKQFMERIFRAEEMPLDRRTLREEMGPGAARAMAGQAMLANLRFDVPAFFGAFKGGEAQQRASVERLVLSSPASHKPAASERMEFIRQLVLDPVYQLK